MASMFIVCMYIYFLPLSSRTIHFCITLIQSFMSYSTLNCIPVSYTHLDVYKRQVCQNCKYILRYVLFTCSSTSLSTGISYLVMTLKASWNVRKYDDCHFHSKWKLTENFTTTVASLIQQQWYTNMLILLVNNFIGIQFRVL